MSKTDKTRPLFVKEQDPNLRANFQEWHDHRNGPCDLDEYKRLFRENNGYHRVWKRGQRCMIWVSTHGSHSGMYPRSSNVVQRYRDEDNGEARTYLRMKSREILAYLRADNDYEDDVDVIPYNPRHNALWDAA